MKNEKPCPELDPIDRPCWNCPEAPHCDWCPDEIDDEDYEDEEVET